MVFTSCSLVVKSDIVGKDYTEDYKSGEINENVIAANTGFAFDIFKQLNSEDADKSIFISPLSISTALTMTYNGAETTTLEAMTKALGYEGMDREAVNEGYWNLLTHLDNLDKKIELNIANSIWIREGQAIEEIFLNRNKSTFDAQVDELDFSKDKSADIINDWISNATKGKIDKMIDPPIDPNIVMFLINAIYFKGGWKNPFNPEATFDGTFTSIDGTKRSIRMMYHYGDAEYMKNDSLRAVRLPYGNGSTSMIAILPNEDIDINTFIEGMTEEKLDSIRNSLEVTEKTTLQIPVFKLEYGIKLLNDSLMALGMEEAFGGGADFSGIRPGIAISQVLHKAVIEVNEKGSEASAVTVVAMDESAPEDPAIFIANRPFIFIISDDTTGTILFMGKLADIDG